MAQNILENWKKIKKLEKLEKCKKLEKNEKLEKKMKNWKKNEKLEKKRKIGTNGGKIIEIFTSLLHSLIIGFKWLIIALTLLA